MSAKKKTKALSAKKSAKAAFAKAKPKIIKSEAIAKPDAATPAAGECPQGGPHEWKVEDGTGFCGKCFEPEDSKDTKSKVEQTGIAPRSELTLEEHDALAKARDAKAPNQTKGKTRFSAIDAAAQVLAESGAPLNTRQMIEAMAEKGLWSSPHGKTPHATLYSAILREINTKGAEARFQKIDRGQFVTNAEKE